jgi:pSer/pThr/pTyr-binding forkhead associated (FHA) protein
MQRIWLVELEEDRYHEVDSFPATIGRNSVNAVQVTDRAVSRIHARIGRQGDTIYVEPFETKNPTRLNGDVIPANRAEPLSARDVIELGPTGVQIFFRKSAILDVKKQGHRQRNSGNIGATSHTDDGETMGDKIRRKYRELGGNPEALAERLGIAVKDVERILERMEIE